MQLNCTCPGRGRTGAFPPRTPPVPTASLPGRHKACLFSSDASSTRQHLFPVLNTKQPGCQAVATPLSLREDEPVLWPRASTERPAQPRVLRPRCLPPRALGSSPTAPLQPPHQETQGWRFVRLAKRLNTPQTEEPNGAGSGVGSGTVVAWKPPLHPCLAIPLHASNPGHRPTGSLSHFCTELCSCEHELCCSRGAGPCEGRQLTAAGLEKHMAELRQQSSVQQG